MEAKRLLDKRDMLGSLKFYLLTGNFDIQYITNAYLTQHQNSQVLM